MNIAMKERLTKPLIRENGKHRRATWDEALDRVAEGFRTQIEKHGPRTFGMFSCSKTTNELNYVAQKFVRSVIGTNNIDSCNRT
jgi:predicted molibdopterin-dependent oxidoreductase YjgC